MTSSTKPSFQKRVKKLPPAIREATVERLRLWQRDPWHASLQFKNVGKYWSIRIVDGYRAVATREGDHVTWTWIGDHDEYLRVIRR
jgi:mRNA-degrading endonuclease RelE of RelBE toxin-antitoxin system